MIATKRPPGVRHDPSEKIRIPIRKEARCTASVTVAPRDGRWWACYKFTGDGYGGIVQGLDSQREAERRRQRAR